MKERKSLINRIMPIAVPIMMQYFVLSVINATNTMMMGLIDEISLSAISVGNQIMNIYTAFMIGLWAGAPALFAQFWGIRNVESERRVESIALQISMGCSVLVFLATLFIPDTICSWYTKDAAVQVQAAEYLRITSVAYIAMGFSQVYLTLLKTTGNVKRSSIISVATGVVGICLSAVLVFGYMGAPKLGLVGAALSVSVSRCFEFIVTVVDCRQTRKFWLSLKELFSRNQLMRGRFYRAALPALVNTMGYNIAMSVTVGIMGHIGTTALAAFAVANVVFMLFTPIATGYGSAMGIVVGNALGRNELELAKKLGDAGMHLGWRVGICATIVMCACSLFTPVMGSKLTDVGRTYLVWMIVVLAIKLTGAIINTALANGIFAAGGDTIFMCKTDIINMWAVIIPLGLLATNVLKLPVMAVFIILNIDEFTKMPFEYFHYKKYKWVRNLTRKVWTSFRAYHNIVDEAVNLNSHIGVVTIDGKGRVMLMNRRSREILGLTDAEAESQSFAELFIGDRRNDEFVQTVVNAVEGRNPISKNELYYYHGDIVKHLIVDTSFIEDDDTKAGVLLVLDEIYE